MTVNMRSQALSGTPGAGSTATRGEVLTSVALLTLSGGKFVVPSGLS